MIRFIAAATFREAVRSRSFLGLVGLYVLGVLLARVAAWVSPSDADFVATDLVLSLQSIIGVLVAVATGTVLVHSEIKQRTLYTVLSRPFGRWQFVVGKFLGLAAALMVGQVAMLALGLIWLLVTGAEVHRWLILAGLLTTLEVLVMAAIALCWTALSSPLLAAALGLATYGLGHAVASLPGLMNHLEGWKRTLATVLAGFVPNLGFFTYRDEAVHHLPLPPGDALAALGYAALWITLLLVITESVYRRKQL